MRQSLATTTTADAARGATRRVCNDLASIAIAAWMDADLRRVRVRLGASRPDRARCRPRAPRNARRRAPQSLHATDARTVRAGTVQVRRIDSSCETSFRGRASRRQITNHDDTAMSQRLTVASPSRRSVSTCRRVGDLNKRFFSPGHNGRLRIGPTMQLSRRDLVHVVGGAAVAALAPRRADAQAQGAQAAQRQPPSVISNPPRDFTPDAQPVTYPDPD